MHLKSRNLGLKQVVYPNFGCRQFGHPVYMIEFPIPIRFIEIEKAGVHIAISGFVNGNLANILIDTGASQTVFDKNRIHLFSDQTEFEKAEKLSKGLGTDSMEGFKFSIRQFILGDLLLDDFEIVSLDLGHINASYRELGLNSIDMVLGGDFLRKYEASIRYGSAELWLTI
ncbi:MAG: aspartyl protease family protein [Flavobacteriales bacterium]|nr:aspartyl protease family protein [Flavobacteriales bacterium]